MLLDLQIVDFLHNGKIDKKYICSKQGGDNISPKIRWNPILGAKSYALIFEDPDAPAGTFIHWFIPSIKKHINAIDSLENKITINVQNNSIINKFDVVQHNSSSGDLGYHGPCAPKDTGTHRYIFFLYALSDIISFNNVNPYTSIEFENILQRNNINIIAKDTKQYFYRYMNM